MPRLLIFDAMGLAYRAYYAFISRPLINSRGENTSAIYGFANTVIKLRREERPDYWALAWDGPGPTFRHEQFPEYKATRKPMPEDLVPQIEPIGEMAAALGLPVLEVPGMEADDVMATLARCGERDGYEVILVTSDKDMLQLVNDRIHLLSPVGRGEEYVRIDPSAVKAKWGVSPEQTRDVLALMGDSIDNIPGVPGVGEKTAVELMSEYGSLEELYLRVDQVRKPALKEKLKANRERAFLSRELVTVRADCDLPFQWEKLRMGPVSQERLLELTSRFEMPRLLKAVEQLGALEMAGKGPLAGGRGMARRDAASATTSHSAQLDLATDVDKPEAPAGPAVATQGALDLWAGADTPRESFDDNDLEARVRALVERAAGGLAMMPLWSGGHPRRGRVVGIGLAAPESTPAYVPLAHEGGRNVAIERLREWLAPALRDPAAPRYGESLKRDAHLLEGLELPSGLESEAPRYDLQVLSFLCDTERNHSLAAIAQDFAGITLADPQGVGNRRVRPSELPVEAGAAVARAAAAMVPLAEVLRAQLESRDQWKLYQTLERPLIAVLFAMEREGITLDAEVLRATSAEAGAEIERLRAELVEMAGEAINLDSGPQVARVLFETLKLAPRGRTPGGAYSTRQDVLEELAARHPFPARLLEYRALTKLKSTYYDALPAEVDARDGRVHTEYFQAGAATGRLASSNPNLQNIPMRTERGRQIRRAFVARPGGVLIGADYSQIELRVMAHLSGDPNLMAAFEGGEDIHASTARRIFSIEGALDPGLRARAKIVNFGVMYGMGSRSLAQQMGIELAEAQRFIADYFRVFQGVRAFLDRTIEEARRRGYVETLLGRRRYLPGLESTHGGERSATERAAINTPLQGSAADLIKLAMIRVHHTLKQRFPSARLLLQVHDELLLECDAGDADGVGEVVRAEMEGCFPLRVPLVVTVGRGPTWLDVH